MPGEGGNGSSETHAGAADGGGGDPGAVMSSTGVVAIFIPVVLSVANRMGIPADAD